MDIMFLKDRRRRPEGGWMGANQNSSPEFGLCPKINPKSLSSNSASANKTTREIDDKNSTQNGLSPLRHFTEHLVCVFEKSPRGWKLN
jgi:hypothetical protein